MIHFTSNAFVVTANISGRHGQYGSTTSIIGMFNKEKTAITERDKFITAYNKNKSRMYQISERQVTIHPMQPNVTNEQIISKVYE